MILQCLPRLSVILPVYNGLPHLREAVESIINQSFTDFELLIVNDGSTDDSAQLLEKISDPRVQVFTQENLGLAATLNRAIAHAQGQYIARQDQDDVSFPDRFRSQIEYLDSNPDVALVGTAAEIWENNHCTPRLLNHPTHDAALRLGLLFDNFFVHSSVMMRRAVVQAAGGYSEDVSRQPPEDYELWSRLMRKHKMANLPDRLMAYREVSASMSRSGNNPFLHKLVQISTENVAWASGLPKVAPEILGLVGLLHLDYDSVPRGASFSAMATVLRAAIHGMGRHCSAPPSYVKQAIRQRTNQLRFRYADYLSGGKLGRTLNKPPGRLIKNLAKRLASGSS